MFTKRILVSAFVIMVVSALVVGGTLAYFANTEQQDTAVSTAKIALDGTAGFPLNYSLLLPGETQQKIVQVQNVGNRPADFYVQQLWDGVGLDVCYRSDKNEVNMVLWVKIENLTDGTTPYDNWVCYLVPGWSGSQIAKIADDVGVGSTRTFRISVTLAATADNFYMDKANAEKVNLIAVQYNGPAPIPDKDGDQQSPPKYDAAWPNDPYGNDDDPNY